jgi:hypothetical protein
MADRGRRGGPYAAAVELTADPVTQPQNDCASPELPPARDPWIKPLSVYERKETTTVEGLRYG